MAVAGEHGSAALVESNATSPDASLLVTEMRALITTMDRLIEDIRIARLERDRAQQTLMDALASALGDGRHRVTRMGVTPAELRAMRVYARTGSMRKTADELHVAEQTIKNHMASVRRRLGAANTAQALIMLGLPSER